MDIRGRRTLGASPRRNPKSAPQQDPRHNRSHDTADMAPQNKLQVLISGDMEGIYGVHCPEMVSLAPKDEELYNRGKLFYTNEVNAVIEGIFNGVRNYNSSNSSGDACHQDIEVIVADGHAKSTNFVTEALDKRARLAPREEEVMMLSGIRGPNTSTPGLNGSENARMTLFVGYHGMARFDVDTNQNISHNDEDVANQRPSNFLAHTSSATWIRQVRVNDELVSEGTMNALLAQFFGCKTVFVSGTDEGVAEIAHKIPDIHGLACIKSRSWADGVSVLLDGTARSPDAEQDKSDSRHYQELREAAARAVEAELSPTQAVSWILPGGPAAAQSQRIHLQVELKRALAEPGSNDELEALLEEADGLGVPRACISEGLDTFNVRADNIYLAHCIYRNILAFLRGRPLP